ncbi:guanine deaminase [Parasulfitobacter algicola]|uniref:Guanine deaminase n=1 Tax=Parasulfitobacter algicola TaxID=2614809 RepID=A0ABX2IVH0_9RHOB|nr:guanine deaminase [Sulfitobacter algicola]NSX56505.1 guanine deaminase [Sulfitobacter algicola]
MTVQDRLLLGQTLSFIDDPFDVPVSAAVQYIRDGAVLLRGHLIADVDEAVTLKKAHPNADITDYGDALILPGFIDAHVHYPQTAIIASWGKQLIDWLNTYTFPEEIRFSDHDYATVIANRYLDLVTAHGTTTVVSYCTSHPESVDAFFTAASARNMRVVAGKTCMDRNAPDALMDTAQSAYDDSKRLLEKWHERGRASYAITPRFSPTSTPDQLTALGALWAEHPDCLMQTHISEQKAELDWVAKLFPDARDYLDTYERFGLLGQRGLYGHAIHLTARESDRLREMGAALIHCPTSNTFIGSGLFDMAARKSQGHIVGLATDTGGGSSFSMLRTMAAAYEIGQLNGTALHPAQLLWLASAGNARTLHMGNKIGKLQNGFEADLVVLDLASTPAIAQRSGHADDIWQAVFPTIMMGDDRAVMAVWINGQSISLENPNRV